MTKEKKPVVDQVFRREGSERRPSEIRSQTTTPTSGLRNSERRGSISPPKSRQREISWVDYEDLIKARHDEKQIVTPASTRSPLSRSPSPVSRAPSRGRSPAGSRSKRKQQLEEADGEDIRRSVRFSASVPVQPRESLPFPFLRRTSQVALPGERRRSSVSPFSLERGKNFEGELHIEEGRSIVTTPRVPGDEQWRDATREPASIIQKLHVEGLAMQIPQYLAGMRGESRRSSLRALSTFGELLSSHRRSAFVRSVMASTNIDGAQPIRVSNKYITLAPKARLSTVIVPVNAKQWLLQVMCQKDLQLRELFDQMELVPQFAGDHVREVRAEWLAQEAFQMPVPPEAETLIKDKTLLDRVKGLLVHFNEPVHSKSPEMALMEEEGRDVPFEDGEPEMEEPRNIQALERKISRSRSPPKVFQGFERDREGSLSPVFGLGASLCPLCGQIQKTSFAKDGQLLPPNLKLMGDARRTYLSFNEKRWFIVLFPALQPANKEKIELLGEWLRYAIHQNDCEDFDGRFADVGSAFILHSIAFLEVVRQVRLQCEERGDILLHVWRQILRLFSQVMIRVEPTLLTMMKETSSVNDSINSYKQKIDHLLDELATTTHNLEFNEAELREKELLWSQLKRCRLCAGDGHGHDHGRGERTKGSTASGKRVPGAGGDFEEGDHGTFGFGKSHQRGKGGDHDNEDGGHGGGADSRDGALKLGGDQGATSPSSPGSPGGPGGAGSPGAPSGPGGLAGKQGEVLDSYKPGKISECYLHPDGLYADVGAQTDPDTTGRSLFFNILERPVTAPGRLITAIMEEFQLAGGVVHRDLADGEEPVVKKEPEVTGLTAADIAMLDATDDMAEEIDIGSINRLALKSLATDGLHILEHVPEDHLEVGMADKLTGLLGRFRNLKLSNTDGDEDSEDGEEGNGKKKSRWGKLQRGFDDSMKRQEKLVSIVQELLARNKKPPTKMTKPKDLPNVPLGFTKMMKINPPPKVVKLFNEHQVVKLVDAVYQKKIEADAVDDAQGNERQNACEFLYDYMLNSYGLKGLAESAIHGVFRRIKQMMIKGIDKSHKLRLFQQFCGFDPLRGYGEPDFYLYLRCLAKAQSKVGVLFPTENEDGTFINTNPNQTDILLEEPTVLAQFRGSKDVAVDFLEKFAAAHGFVEKVSSEVQKLVKAPTVRKLDFDLLMEAIIEVAPHKMDTKKVAAKPKVATKAAPAMTKEESAALETLFKAGDANQDGVLTFNEFREIIETADSSVSEKKALRMFRETLLLMPDGGDNISPAAFATVAHSNDIQATPAMIYDLLKKTWSQIQDDVNEEKLADKVNRKDCDDMQDALEDMLKEKRPADVFKAVQTFSTFVLRFCGGEEGAGAPEELEAEAKEEEEIND